MRLEKFGNNIKRIVRDYYIVYRIKPDMIYILSVWDTRQNPIKLEEIVNTK